MYRVFTVLNWRQHVNKWVRTEFYVAFGLCETSCRGRLSLNRPSFFFEFGAKETETNEGVFAGEFTQRSFFITA